jgi:transposase-like protein
MRIDVFISFGLEIITSTQAASSFCNNDSELTELMRSTAIKRRTRPMLGFKTFRCARILLGGIEVMHMIAKGQMIDGAVPKRSVAEQFYFPAT